MQIRRVGIRYFLYCTVPVVFFVVGCVPLDDTFEEDRRSKSVIEMMGVEENLAFAHMMRNLQIEEPEMKPADRKYLSKHCDVKDCHDLNRVFWLHGPRSTWEKVLGIPYHRKIKIKPEEKERLFGIFQRYLNQPYFEPVLKN